MPGVGAAPYVVTGGLGVGGFACVVAVESMESGQAFALKVVNKTKFRRLKDQRRLARELFVMYEVPACPFLIGCHDAFETAEEIFYVLDLIPGGSLFDYMKKKMKR